jgi:hypothetical protein
MMMKKTMDPGWTRISHKLSQQLHINAVKFTENRYSSEFSNIADLLKTPSLK